MTTADSDRAGSAGNASDSDSEASFELPDALATGREKRLTAGNRLRDMLNAEIESEAIFAEDEQDEDFGSEQDLQDDLDSELDDASSGDEHQAIEPEDAGERLLQKQEKQSARISKRKAHEAFSKPKASKKTTLPDAGAQKPAKADKKTRRDGTSQAQRQSSRAHAREIAGAVERRLQDEALKKSTTIKVAKSEDRPLTQAERLEEAKVTEAENVASLNKIVKYEEERRTNQKLLAARRKTIGPFIRFISSNRARSLHGRIGTHEAPAEAVPPMKTAETASLMHPLDVVQDNANVDSKSKTGESSKGFTDTRESTPMDATASLSTCITLENLQEGPLSTASTKELLLGPAMVENRQYPESVKCAISGLPTKYKDPRTGITFGNAFAYKTLQELETGSIPWNPQLKMYVPRCTM